MAAHKIRAITRAADGTEITIYPETVASQVICIVQGSDGSQQEINLDDLLNQYADEINDNGQNVSALQTSKVLTDGTLYNLLNFGYIDSDAGTAADTKPATLMQVRGERLDLNPYSFVPYKPPQDAARFIVFDGFATIAGEVLTLN